jgi:hypothetical protein
MVRLYGIRERKMTKTKVDVIELVDYYTQRTKDLDGTSLKLFQYKYSIYQDGVEYKVRAKFIGNSYFYMQISGNNKWCGGYFDEHDSVETVHEKLIGYLTNGINFGRQCGCRCSLLGMAE